MRELALRILFGAVYLAVVIAAMLDGWAFAAIAAAATAIMLDEFFRMKSSTKMAAARWVAIFSVIAAFALVLGHARWGLDAKFIYLCALPLLLLAAFAIWEKAGMDEFAHLFAGLLYIGLPMALSPLLMYRTGSFDGRALLSFLILVWGSDIGAYCIGSAFGQKEGSRKLCPSISPHKSWAGFWGGMGLCIAAAMAVSATGLLPLPWYHAAGIAVVAHLAGTMGDLFESRWKRDAGVKDSGSLIPGHGGLLDRLDSTIAAVPAAVAYLVAFNIW